MSEAFEQFRFAVPGPRSPAVNAEFAYPRAAFLLRFRVRRACRTLVRTGSRPAPRPSAAAW